MIASRSASGSWQKPTSRAGLCHSRQHATKILRRRLGLMCEQAVRLAAQKNHIATEHFQQRPAQHAARSMIGIEQHAKLPSANSVDIDDSFDQREGVRTSYRLDFSTARCRCSLVARRLPHPASGTAAAPPARRCRHHAALRRKTTSSRCIPPDCGWPRFECRRAHWCCRTSTPVVGVAAMPPSNTRRLPFCESPSTTGATTGPFARPSRVTSSGPSGSVAANAAA